MDDSYVGKTDRDLLVEIYTCVCEMDCKLEDHEGRIRETEQEGARHSTYFKIIGGVLTAAWLLIVRIVLR